MFHTLLPIQEKKDLRHEYRVRAGIVLMFVISIAGFIGIISLFPTLIRAHNIYRAMKGATMSVSIATNKTEVDRIKSDLKKYNPLVSYLLSEKDNNISAFIETVVNLRGDVSLSSITVTRPATSTMLMAVEGGAPTRNSLLSFKSRLEATGVIKVDLPVSELAKSKDVRFSMRIQETLK